MITRPFHLGLPPSWHTINIWFSHSAPLFTPTTSDPPPLARFFPQLPILPDYHNPPSQPFWSHFPSSTLPPDISTPINQSLFASLVHAAFPSWSFQQRSLAQFALHSICHGAQPRWEKPLTALFTPNTPSAFLYGAQITDTIASWITKGFVAGPFLSTPLPAFRVNPLLAIPQQDKIRLVLNLSAPPGSSYNDCLDKLSLPRAAMSSPRRFSHGLWHAGQHATFIKPDMSAAYKNIPQHPSVWPAQGFFWLGCYFVDTSTVFGSTAAVAQFDAFAASLQNLTLLHCPVPSRFIFRQLDDLPVINPAGDDSCSQFYKKYLSLCDDLNVKLSPPCPQFEKSFGPTNSGIVLGIRFHSPDLTWSLPSRKITAIAQSIDQFLALPTSKLPALQHLLGLFNDVSLMFEFLRYLRAPLQFYLNSFHNDPHLSFPIPSAVRNDLITWRHMLPSLASGLPIHPPPHGPPFSSLCFWSDAAAGVFPSSPDIPLPPRGVASLGGQALSDLWFGARLTWPHTLITSTRDSRGNFFGHNSTTLEAIGLLLPLLSIPHLCAHRPLLFFVDNLPLTYAFQKRYAKHDPETSLILRCFFLLSSYLSCDPYIRFLPRCSTPLFNMVDYLSRQSSPPHPLPTPITPLRPSSHPSLFFWLNHPTLDWDLPFRLLEDLRFVSSLPFSGI
jgi:hypothetical protein